MQLWTDEMEALRRRDAGRGRRVARARHRDDGWQRPDRLGDPHPRRAGRAGPQGDGDHVLPVARRGRCARSPASRAGCSRRPDRRRAIYLHFHGGGMMIGAPEMSDYSSVDLRDRFDLAVVSVDYRLAPEHPHPAGPDDGVAVADWLLANGEQEFGASRLIVGGESAGGYMAAIVACCASATSSGAIERVAGANLVFGVYDWGRSPSQRGIRADARAGPARPGRHRVLHRVLPARPDRRRAPRPVDLARVRRSAGPAARADERRDVRPPARRHAACSRPVGPRPATRSTCVVLPEMPHGFMAVPGAHGEPLDRAHQRVVRRRARSVI